jgi:hypothetical protein
VIALLRSLFAALFGQSPRIVPLADMDEESAYYEERVRRHYVCEQCQCTTCYACSVLPLPEHKNRAELREQCANAPKYADNQRAILFIYEQEDTRINLLRRGLLRDAPIGPDWDEYMKNEEAGWPDSPEMIPGTPENMADLTPEIEAECERRAAATLAHYEFDYDVDDDHDAYVNELAAEKAAFQAEVDAIVDDEDDGEIPYATPEQLQAWAAQETIAGRLDPKSYGAIAYKIMKATNPSDSK